MTYFGQSLNANIKIIVLKKIERFFNGYLENILRIFQIKELFFNNQRGRGPFSMNLPKMNNDCKVCFF